MQQEIPGLYLFESFFSSKVCKSILNTSRLIYNQLESNQVLDLPENRASIPQPEFVKSKVHNLSSEEKFVRVNIKDLNDHLLKGEYFPKYGEYGHALVYFRGHKNLPCFIYSLLPSIKELIASNNIMTQDIENSWRLTINFYKNISGVVSGFPFHVDIPANGIITMILNVHREAIFQITDGHKIIDIRLAIGALLILSGDSRYKWKHRVLPSKSTMETENKIERISLVLGVK